MRGRLLPSLMAAGLGGLVLGLLSPPPAQVAETTAQDVAWLMPTPSQLSRYDAGDMAAARGLRWQGATRNTASGGPETSSPPRWVLLGIVTDPEPVALIQVKDQPQVERVRVGETTPDGSILRSISSNHVELELQGCRFQRRLHTGHGGDDHESNVCLPPSDETSDPGTNTP